MAGLRRIGDFVVSDELGRGADGVVYRAERDGQSFAIKVPLPEQLELNAERAARQLTREAIAMARASHPALPQVHEVNNALEAPYVLMELAQGRSLASLLGERSLELAEVVQIAWQLTGALRCLHASGVVHRDLSLRNVVYEPSEQRVKLIDFGSVASRSMGSEATRDGGSVNGSPVHTFFSPPLDTAADVSALGRLLFDASLGRQGQGLREPTAFLADLDASGSTLLEPRLAKLLARVLTPDTSDSVRTATELGRALQRSFPELLVSALPEGLPPSSLLGRQKELGVLRRHWQEACAGGGRIVLLQGVAGSGKTALVGRFLQRMDSDVVLLHTKCEPWSSQPFDAVRTLLESYLRALGSMSPELANPRLEVLRALAQQFAPLMKLLSPALAALAGDVRAESEVARTSDIVVEGLAEFFSKFLRAHPATLVLVDDVQWLDASSRGVLKRATDGLGSAAAMFLLVTRSEVSYQEAVGRALAGVPSSYVHELSLGRLAPTDVNTLIQEQLGAQPISVEDLRALASLTDGFPLSALQALTAVLDSGALVPHWGKWKLDHGLLATMNLPNAMRDILARRIAVLEPVVERVLRGAAAVGPRFEEWLLCEVLGMQQPEVEATLMVARGRMLVEAGAAGGYRFVHEAVREAFLETTPSARRRELRQQCAEVLDAHYCRVAASSGATTGGPTLGLPPEQLFQLANYYLSGYPERSPERAFQVMFAAGRAAFDSFDNTAALGYFSSAETVGACAPPAQQTELEYHAAETLLRLGDLDVSLQRFEQASQQQLTSVRRAWVLSRIAWIHESRFDSEAAWQALNRALAELGEVLPTEAGGSLVRTAARWLVRSRTRSKPLTPEEKERLQALCAIYYQVARLAADAGKPLRLLQAAARAVPLAERLGPSLELVRIYSVASFVLVALGQRERGRALLNDSRSVAHQLENPVATTHVMQVGSVICSWAGDIAEAVALGGRCLTDYGHWQELAEYCALANSLSVVESIRGRTRDAWTWIERAVIKIDQHEGNPVVNELVALRARASLASVGRDAEATLILRRVQHVSRACSKESELYGWTYGPRLGWFTERGDLGAEFEALVTEVAARALNPKRVPLIIAEYYVHLCHARVHQLLRLRPEARGAQLSVLQRCTADLKQAARVPLLVAHYRVVRAYWLWFRAEAEAAEQEFAQAERLARNENNAWVLYAVYRGRAHVLDALGESSSARDQATLALALAREHGAAYRARWVEEEFQLGRSTRSGLVHRSDRAMRDLSPESESMRTKRHLHALLQVSRATSHQLDPIYQARAVLDELIRAIGAERGLLFLRAEERLADTPLAEQLRQDLQWVAGRDAYGADLSETTDHEQVALRQALSTGGVVLLDANDIRALSGRAQSGARSVVCAPLVLRDKQVGAVYLDSSLSNDAFGPSDGELLSALAGQIPVTLELAKALRDRERLSEDLRQAQKMEALGRLAGGIAHDFNNMLGAIRVSADCVLLDDTLSEDVREDARTIQSAADKAASLTNQLLAFSRRQILQARVVSINAVIEDVLPMLRRLLGPDIHIHCSLAPDIALIKADVAQLEQVLLNLALNARDAMPEGGQLQILTENYGVSLGQAGLPVSIEPGRYVGLCVVDSGKGMDEQTRLRIFEPFFTTKEEGSGTGLGLAIVHAMVTQSGGAVEVESQPGQGTQIRAYFPITLETRVDEELGCPARELKAAPMKVLLVEDEALVRRTLVRVLEREGHDVFSARTPREALALAEANAGQFDLLLTDVMLPEMNGVQLSEELQRRHPGFQVLFMSGYIEGGLVAGLEKRQHQFLRKPVSHQQLIDKIAAIMAKATTDPVARATDPRLDLIH